MPNNRLWASTREWGMERGRVNSGDRFVWEGWRRWNRIRNVLPKSIAGRSTYLDLKPWEKRRLRGALQTLLNRVKLQMELEKGMSRGVERWESVRVLQSGRGIFVGRKERYQPRL